MTGKREVTEFRKRYLRLRVSEQRRKMKARAIAYKGGVCESCGFVGHPSAYDFHHADPSQKDFQISSGDYKSFARTKPELDKTVLLCANCHRTEHGLAHDASFEERRNELQDFKTANPPVSGRRLKKVYIPCVTCAHPVLATEGRVVVTCSRDCADRYNEKIDWPSDDSLKALMWAEPCLNVAQRLGVTVKAVKTRCKRRGMDVPSTGYWSAHSQASIAAHAALEKTIWPSDEDLSRVIMQAPMTQLANQLGVTETAVRKRCKARNIPTPPRGYWAKQASAASPP